jgi:hypothetical protein
MEVKNKMANITVTNYEAYDGIKPEDTEQALFTGSGVDTFIRGTLLGRITSGGKYYAYNTSDSPSGTNAIKGILLNQVVTATSADYPCGVMLTGEIDEDKVMIDGGTQGANITEAIKDILRGLGIIVKSKTEFGAIDNPQ